jgi:transcriptional regulator with PAS, ATPase and Fis domain
LCDGQMITESHVQQALQSGRRAILPAPTAAYGTVAPPSLSMAEHQRAALHQVVSQHTGSRAELAAQLGISERSLYRKLKALALPAP